MDAQLVLPLLLSLLLTCALPYSYLRRNALDPTDSHCAAPLTNASEAFSTPLPAARPIADNFRCQFEHSSRVDVAADADPLDALVQASAERPLSRVAWLVTVNRTAGAQPRMLLQLFDQLMAAHAGPVALLLPASMNPQQLGALIVLLRGRYDCQGETPDDLLANGRAAAQTPSSDGCYYLIRDSVESGVSQLQATLDALDLLLAADAKWQLVVSLADSHRPIAAPHVVRERLSALWSLGANSAGLSPSLCNASGAAFPWAGRHLGSDAYAETSNGFEYLGRLPARLFAQRLEMLTGRPGAFGRAAHHPYFVLRREFVAWSAAADLARNLLLLYTTAADPLLSYFPTLLAESQWNATVRHDVLRNCSSDDAVALHSIFYDASGDAVCRPPGRQCALALRDVAQLFDTTNCLFAQPFN